MPIRQCTCPGCGKAVSYKEEWERKRGKCLDCGTVMTFAQAQSPEEFIGNIPLGDDEPAAPRAARPRPRETVAPPAMRSSPGQSDRTARRAYTAWESLLLKTGIAMVVMGVLSFILPYLGLQFRQLNNEKQVPVAIGLIILGALMAVLVGIRAYPIPKLARRVMIWAPLVLIAFATLQLVIKPMVGWGISQSRMRARSGPPIGVRPPDQPLGSQFRTGWEKAQERGEAGQLVFVGAASMDKMAVSKKILGLLTDKGYGTGASFQTERDEIRVKFYPVVDMVDFVKRLGLGTRQEVDEAKKEARIYF